MGTISRLTYYPVKGCAGTTAQSADVTPAGLAHDREFIVTDPDGDFRSQRRFPVMAAIRPRLVDGGTRLALSAPGIEDLTIEVQKDGNRHPASTFGWSGEGVHQGADAAEWFSTVVGQPSVLLGVTPEHDRVTSGETPGTARFADGHAILVISESSLDHLNERIAERGGEPVPMDRFRPNLVIRGWAEPHAEDSVRRMEAGGAEFAYAKLCVRCAVPMVDQETGKRSGPEPIRSLAAYHRDPAGGVLFGMKAAVTRPGQLAVGDAVMVHSSVGPIRSTEAAEPPLTATASFPAESV